jgi:hypothetical protein
LFSRDRGELIERAFSDERRLRACIQHSYEPMILGTGEVRQ